MENRDDKGNIRNIENKQKMENIWKIETGQQGLERSDDPFNFRYISYFLFDYSFYENLKNPKRQPGGP